MIDPPAEVRRIVFFGTPREAFPSLASLARSEFEVVLVVTGPDKRRGRRAEPSPSHVKALALTEGIPVSHDVDDALEVDADLGVVVAFGQIIKPHVLERLAMVNVHFSLLPRWRGAAPVERAILAGDQVTGVCLMEVAEGLDTGGVYRRVEMPIAPDATADSLREHLAVTGAVMLEEALSEGLGQPEPQQGTPVYAHKVTRDDLRLRWDQPAEYLHRQVRVGGAWTTLRGKTLKIWQADLADGSLPPGKLDGAFVGTGGGVLCLREVQLENRPRQPAQSWLRGARLGGRERLGS